MKKNNLIRLKELYNNIKKNNDDEILKICEERTDDKIKHLEYAFTIIDDIEDVIFILNKKRLNKKQQNKIKYLSNMLTDCYRILVRDARHYIHKYNKDLLNMCKEYDD